MSRISPWRCSKSWERRRGWFWSEFGFTPRENGERREELIPRDAASAEDAWIRAARPSSHNPQSNRRRRFPRWIVERQRGHFHVGLQADCFNRDFHLQLCPRLRISCLDTGQRNHLLQDRRPAGGSGFAYLLLALVDRYSYARGLRGSGRRQAVMLIELLHVGPIHFEADQLPRNTILRVLFQRALADEVFFVEMHHLGEAQLVGRIFLGWNQCFLGARVVDLNQEKPSL